MKTKFLAFVLVILVLFPQVYAQKKRKVDTGIHFGILGGLNLQTIIGKDYWGEKLNNNLFPGFHAGGNVILSFGPDLYIQPGLLFTVKGAKQDIITDNITKTTRLSYVEVPLNILFRPQVGDGHILLGLGPYAAYGIMGKERTKSGAITTELTVKYLNDAADKPTSYVYYRGLDAGANIFFGYELYNGIFCQLNGQLGLLKMNSDYNLPNDQASKKHLGFGLSVGYRF
jgi:hypothetical protein